MCQTHAREAPRHAISHFGSCGLLPLLLFLCLLLGIDASVRDGTSGSRRFAGEGGTSSGRRLGKAVRRGGPG